MGSLVQLEERRRSKAAQRAFGRWEQRLGVTPAPEDRLAHLPDVALARLAELDHPATLALYDLVLGVRDWGRGEVFYELDPRRRLEALDAFLFLADQVRFEVMRRLGWLSGFAGETHSLLDLAGRPREIQGEFYPPTPRLSPDHPRYAELRQRLEVEPGLVIRSLIPEALHRFRRQTREK